MPALVKDYWKLAAFFATALLIMGGMQYNVRANTGAIADNVKEIRRVSDSSARTETKLDIVAEDVNEIQADVKKILERMPRQP